MGLGAINGPVAMLGDFVSADTILPARHSYLPPAQMAEHVLAELGPDVNARVRNRPILVVGEAFGYGTGREAPARAMRATGVKLILGASFARMFYRNAINNGLLLLECPLLVRSGIVDGDVVELDPATSVVRWRDQTFSVPEVPPMIAEIIAAGDLVEYGRRIVQHKPSAHG